MEHNTDNFDALWDRLKQAVRERREPQTVRTMSHLPFATFEADLSTGPVVDGEDSVTLRLGTARAFVAADATRDDLINIAEHCILRAAQFEQR